MKSLFSRWTWKGFLIRYSVILIILLAINFIMSKSDDTHTNDTYQTQATQPSFEVTHEVKGQEVHMEFELQHFELSLKNVNKEKVNGQGHLHVYIDGEKVAKVYDKHFVLKNVPMGTHEIKIELAHNDHESLGIDKSFTVKIQ
ncbi:hypothetical protein [Caldalkalibacillus mannanilyticus]|uniref:hypothetical protein n=1 Tax=Caldalkalibacillus mannanilyticus TaxID=1418 RepID=UPI0004689AA3|nr:hypothetical protein [Caldalkalibacillus mannanilyticus]